LFNFLDLDLTLDVPPKGSDKEAVWTLLNLAYLDILWWGYILPFLSMFNVHFLGDIADWFTIPLFLWPRVHILSMLMIYIPERL